MKKIINAPERYVEDMLRGIYAAHGDLVKCAAADPRCFCTAHKKPGKVAIVTGGGTGHLPLFLGYVGDGLIDGCGVGGVFQSPSPEQIYEICREVNGGAGVQKRGKCEAGQRTLYDALLPAAEAAKKAAQLADAGLESVITAALAAAAQGVEATKTMTPVFGKAAVHAAQAQNTPDQGALAGYYLLLGLKTYICG